MLPTEDTEQTVFVNWCEVMGLKLTAVPNSTWTSSWSQKAKNHRTGLRPGFPDLVVLIPPLRSIDGQGRFLCIEMKRQKRGVISPEQKSWIAAVNSLETTHVVAYVAKGAEEAKDIVSKHLQPAQRKNAVF